MKLIYTTLTLLACVLLTASAVAQKRVTGMVTSSGGEALIGATVVEVGTSNGTSTDINGKYQITVADGASLRIAYTGYASKTEAVAGRATVDVSLSEDALLDEVVVTALGISREKKSLTYGAQEISSEDLTRVKDANVINSLSGRTAGLQINRSGSGVGDASHAVPGQLEQHDLLPRGWLERVALERGLPKRDGSTPLCGS